MKRRNCPETQKNKMCAVLVQNSQQAFHPRSRPRSGNHPVKQIKREKEALLLLVVMHLLLVAMH